jgi:tripeptide aminopeptidase
MIKLISTLLFTFCVYVSNAQTSETLRAKRQEGANYTRQTGRAVKQSEGRPVQPVHQIAIRAQRAQIPNIKGPDISRLSPKNVRGVINEKMKNRFLSYVSIESQSVDEPDMNSFPMTEGQKSIARHIYEEVKAFSKGIINVTLSDDYYVYIDIPSNTKEKVPSVLFMAHLDVTPEAPGIGIKPIVHPNYNGGDIILSNGKTLSPNTPQGAHLKDLIGKTIITSDGTTLLGADDKTGCAILVTLAEYLTILQQNHGRVMIVLSQNEDVGKAALRYDPSVFGCRPDIVIDFDGSTYDKFSVANFTAIGQTYYFKGNKAHPSNGKANKYADALTAACHFVGLIPPQLSPSATEGQEGYVHCYSLTHPLDSLGKVIDNDYVVKVRLRYFDQNDGLYQKQLLTDNMQKTHEAFPFVEIKKTDDQMQYENIAYTMPEYVPDIISRAAKRIGMEMTQRYSRAGTTSAMMVARFPDLMPGGSDVYSGQNAIHSCYEWACIEELVQLTDMAMYIVLDIAKNKYNK